MPTVSTSTTSKPAASHTSIASRVRWATPPSEPPEGDGRMKARSSWARLSMRVLSPRMLPPVTGLLGSTASTATRWPFDQQCRPRSVSMKVLLPTPGGPVMPTRSAPGVGDQLLEDRLALRARPVGSRALEQVMALAMARRSPAGSRRGRPEFGVRAPGLAHPADRSDHLQHLAGAFGHGVPGSEDRRDPFSRRNS